MYYEYVDKDGLSVAWGEADTPPKAPAGTRLVVHKAPVEPTLCPDFLCREVRKRNYPPIGDQLDAIWKLLESQPDILTPEVAGMLTKIQKVKADNPKPNK